MAYITYKKIKEYLGLNTKTSPKRNNKKFKFNKIKSEKKKLIFKVVNTIIIFGGIIFIVGIIGFGVMVFEYSKELPSPGKPFSNSQQKSVIFDKNGINIGSLYGDNSNREWVALKDISPNMKAAMLAAEDANFYNEPGISITGILRAGINDVFNRGGGLQGASTISQQLAKIGLGDSTRDFNRKIKELILTLEIEKQYTKDQILEAYLNQIPLGGTIYGVKVASQAYFHKDPKDLTVAESAFLAGIPQDPSYYSPFVSDPYESNGNLASTNRADYVLDQMKRHTDTNNMKSSDIAEAVKQVPTFKFDSSYNTNEYQGIINYVAQLLKSQFGSDKVYNGGLQVTTSIDLNMQKAAEQEVHDMYNELNRKEKLKFSLGVGSNGIGADDAGMVSIDPKTGEIMALVGSPDDMYALNVVSDSKAFIQPGSTIKPLLYMLAFKDLGMSPKSFMPDIPITINDYKGTTYPGGYSPTNYEGGYKGLGTIDDALSYSRNIPAIMTLYSLTPEKFLTELQSLGYDGPEIDDPSSSKSRLSFAIGAESVNFLQHVNAYAMMANNGVYYPPTIITKVTDSSGNILYQYKPDSVKKQVIDPAYPYLVDKMLEHYAYMRQMLNSFNYTFANKSGYDIAGKTGTNNVATPQGGKGEASSLTFIGYTPDLVSGFWIGNQLQGQPLNAVGSVGENLVPYWGDYMQQVLPKFPKSQFTKPSDIVEKQVCSDTGLLYVDGQTKCNPVTAQFQKDNVPRVDDMHVDKQVCKSDNSRLATPLMISSNDYSDKIFNTYKTWDPYFQPMLDSFMNGNSQKDSYFIPTAYCSDNPSDYIVLQSPLDQTRFDLGNKVTVSAIITPKDASKTITSAVIYFNSKVVGTLSPEESGNQYSGTFTIPSDIANNAVYQMYIQENNSDGNFLTSKPINIQVGAPTTVPTQ